MASASLDRANYYLPVTPARVRWNWLCAFYAARLNGIAPEEAAAEATKDPEGGAERYRAMLPTKAKGGKSR